MKTTKAVRWHFFISSFFASYILCVVATQSDAAVYSNELASFQHKGKIVDTAVSGDGSLFFALTDNKEILVQSLNGMPPTQLQIDRDYDTITTSPVANIIFLTDSDAQITKLFEIDIIQEFSYEGTPFKGPEDAPVTIAVFSDFQ
jgi:high-affinity nickel permease